MNKKIIGSVAAVIFLVGCGSQQNGDEDILSASDMMGQDGAIITYDCGGEMIKATFSNNAEQKTVKLLVVAEDAAMTLENVEAASGVTYSDGDVTFSVDQGEVQLSMEDTGSALMCTEVSDVE